MFTKTFWRGAFERAVKTAAQSAVAAITATGVATVGGVDWVVVGGTAALATILSVLTALGDPARTDVAVVTDR